MADTFYRIVKTDPPTLIDFTSNAARGRPIRPGLPLVYHRLWDGLSVYDAVDYAEAKARASPMIGRFIAALRFSIDTRVRIERTTTELGHSTIWGASEDLLGRVISVEQVRGRTPRRAEP